MTASSFGFGNIKRLIKYARRAWMREQKLRVILFEDDQAFSDLVRKIIQGFGYEVSAFSDPTVCPLFKNLKTSCPQSQPCADVVITDNMMPNMTGIEFLQLQRSCGCKASDLNKALMSAVTTPQQQEAVKSLGCKFFRKPFKIDALRQWLKECEVRTKEN